MPNPKRIACLLAALLLSQTTAFAWGDTGHLVVAQIALESLSGTPAQRKAKVERLNKLAGMIEFNGGKDYDFVRSAVWMDDLRDDDSHELLRDWHFITLRFPDGVPNNRPTPPVNVVSSINEMQAMLFDKDFEKDDRKGYYVAVLAHLVGDIHQPLHCATRYSPAHRDGDAGGNLFRLKGQPDNLHSYWDGAGGAFETVLRPPLDSDERKLLAKYAADIMQEFPRSKFAQKLAQRDPAKWAAESHQLARTVAHKGIKEDTEPDGDYEEKTRKLSRERIALAGYRLAQVLDRIE